MKTTVQVPDLDSPAATARRWADFATKHAAALAAATTEEERAYAQMMLDMTIPRSRINA